jgi:predicted amidohydrolase
MTPWYSNYPGLDARLLQIEQLLDEMSRDSKRKYGRGLDLALFSEYGVTAGKEGKAIDVAVPVGETIDKAIGRLAKRYQCNIVVGGIFWDGDDGPTCANSAIVVDRKGQLAGRYDKVHPVLDRIRDDGTGVFEGGVRPGQEYNVIDLDIGRIGIQICYDVNFPEGWQVLKEKGAELVLFPTQSPQLTRPAMYAATHEYWVVSSTFRNNASIFEPGTGLVVAQIGEPEATMVHEIDLSYVLLPWSTKLRNGKAFEEAFGDRVGYRYSESEDQGIFWSNDPTTTIGEMAESIGLLRTVSKQLERARDAQDRSRGGPAR